MRLSPASRWLAAALVALAFGAGTRSVHAETKRPSEIYAEKEEKFLRSIGARYGDLGEWCSRNKLWLFAKQNSEKALEFDTNQKEAREYLGFMRRGRSWVKDPEAPTRKEQNEYATGQKLAFEKLVKEYEEKKAELMAWEAGKYADLGIWCRKRRLELQARKAFEHCLKLDPDNEKTRKALGHVRIDGEWLTPEQSQARKDAATGKMVTEGQSTFERQTGMKLNKIESGHFRIESPFGKDALDEYVKGCETVYAYFLRDLGEDVLKKVFREKINHLVLENKEQWHAWVDRNFSGSAQRKEFTKKTAGNVGTSTSIGHRMENGGIPLDVDSLVHKTTHMLVQEHLHLNQSWIKEGFAYYYTVKVLNSTRCYCVAWDEYSNVRNDQGWGDSNNWKELLKGEVQSGADFDLRTICGLKLEQMKLPQAVKAWGLISWFFDHNKEKFMAWMKDVAAGDSQEDAFQKHFEKTFEQLDAEWRDYVKENY